MNGATIISISLTSTNKINQTSSYFISKKERDPVPCGAALPDIQSQCFPDIVWWLDLLLTCIILMKRKLSEVIWGAKLEMSYGK